MNTATPIDPRELKNQWEQLRERQPNVRARDAAEMLGVTEAQLIAAGCGKDATRLSGPWGEVLKQLPTLGPVMALTRNEHAVIEKTGPFGNVEIFGQMGQVLNDAIDLRLFLTNWSSGFAVRTETKDGPRPSLQFFDGTGKATHKVFLVPESDTSAYSALVERYTSPDQSAVESVSAAAAPTAERPDADIDVEGMRTAWAALQDTHEFVSLLKRFNVTRLQAVRLAGAEYTTRVSVNSLRHVLESSARDETPIMVFVGNEGTIEIHTGPVRQVKPTGPWINVLDTEFNLHVREDRIAQAWVVRKPTLDGIVTGLELYDANGTVIALLFGKRKPGQKESEVWRALVRTLPAF